MPFSFLADKKFISVPPVSMRLRPLLGGIDEYQVNHRVKRQC